MFKMIALEDFTMDGRRIYEGYTFMATPKVASSLSSSTDTRSRIADFYYRHEKFRGSDSLLRTMN